jgi:hypothetical protein
MFTVVARVEVLCVDLHLRTVHFIAEQLVGQPVSAALVGPASRTDAVGCSIAPRT